MQDKWNVDYTDEFGAWWEDQSVDVQEKIYKDYLKELEEATK